MAAATSVRTGSDMPAMPGYAQLVTGYLVLAVLHLVGKLAAKRLDTVYVRKIGLELIESLKAFLYAMLFLVFLIICAHNSI